MKLRPQTVDWVLAFLYACLIFYLSSISLPLGAVQPLLRTIPDSVKHVGEYAILSFLLFRALSNSESTALKTNAYLLAITTSIVFGITDETHQFFVPGREFSGFDILSDAVGTCLILMKKLKLRKRMFKK